MASETVKELGKQQSPQTSKMHPLQYPGKGRQAHGLGPARWPELRLLPEAKAWQEVPLSLHVYTFCSGLFSRIDHAILGR